MPKAYWIATYRSIHDPEALAAYAKLAAPALQKAGARFLARGNPAQVYDDGLDLRTVLIEFDSVAQAIAAFRGRSSTSNQNPEATAPGFFCCRVFCLLFET